MSKHESLEEVHGSIDTTKATTWKQRLVLFIGPAFLVAVGYMDPGNWATDIAGGSKYGYSLLWVLVMSNLIALLLQSLAARLGIVRGRDLAQASRETYPPAINFSLWLLAEIAIAACDLAEVLGMAIGLQLLFGLPLEWGVALAVLDTFLILYLQSRGMRYMEAFIFALISVIGISFCAEIIFARPDAREVALGLIPSIADNEALYIAIGIIGATVMPHNLYLHSSLVQTRRNKKDEAGLRTAIRYNLIDSTIALNLAFLVNAAILILAATVFFKNGYTQIAEIHEAHKMLEPLLGKSMAPILFAVALIAAGQSSTVTGTLAGQIIMEGYLDLRIAPWLRRLITRLLAVVPAILVIHFWGEEQVGAMLIFSQVILSLQLGFAIVPLIQFVSDKEKMGAFTIGAKVKLLAWAAALIIVSLNIKLVWDTLVTWGQHAGENPWLFRAFVLPATFAAALLLLVIFYYAATGKKYVKAHKVPHGEAMTLPPLTSKTYKHIAICVDFTKNDVRALAEAVAVSDRNSRFTLIHIVETAGALRYGQNILDFETLSDWKQLGRYTEQLSQQNIVAERRLGFGRPDREISFICDELKPDLLVIAQHGHRGLMDIIMGETISEVRHNVSCPVLVV